MRVYEIDEEANSGIDGRDQLTFWNLETSSDNTKFCHFKQSMYLDFPNLLVDFRLYVYNNAIRMLKIIKLMLTGIYRTFFV